MTNLTMTDLFCGAGGSSTGAVSVPGVTVRLAANHWDKAIETHNTNHPDVDHLQADISNTDPRYVPHTDLLWASPECTNHSRAKGRKQALQPDLFGETISEDAVRRSRATMWDVVRFTEAHRYRAIIVENVVEVADWGDDGTAKGGLFDAWLLAMRNMGYDHRIISLNSMHAQRMGLPAPQSRDRVYIVFWRRGERAPDFEWMLRPQAWCSSCERVVEARQWWKKGDGRRPGRYRQQYLYRCPNTACRNQVVEPAWLPASSIIDWSNPGVRIGDRDKPLSPKTMRRIEVGIERYWQPLTVEMVNGYDAADPRHPGYGNPGSYYRAWPTSDVVRTIPATDGTKALAMHPPDPGRGPGRRGPRALDDVPVPGHHDARRDRHRLPAVHRGAARRRVDGPADGRGARHRDGVGQPPRPGGPVRRDVERGRPPGVRPGADAAHPRGVRARRALLRQRTGGA
nr:hypothetical protein GCM10025730_06290 [Promicromonospora thailandica]